MNQGRQWGAGCLLLALGCEKEPPPSPQLPSARPTGAEHYTLVREPELVAPAWESELNQFMAWAALARVAPSKIPDRTECKEPNFPGKCSGTHYLPGGASWYGFNYYPTSPRAYLFIVNLPLGVSCKAFGEHTFPVRWKYASAAKERCLLKSGALAGAHLIIESYDSHAKTLVFSSEYLVADSDFSGSIERQMPK